MISSLRMKKKIEVDQRGVVYWILIVGLRSRAYVSQVKFYVTVFGAVSYNGRSDLLPIIGRMNSSTYLDYVESALSSHLRRVLNFSRLLTWLADYRIAYLDDYPSVSREKSKAKDNWNCTFKKLGNKFLFKSLTLSPIIFRKSSRKFLLLTVLILRSDVWQQHQQIYRTSCDF